MRAAPIRLLLAAALAAGLAPAPSPAPAADPHPVVDAYRKIIALLDGAGAPDETARQRREVVARYIFHENETRLLALAQALGSDEARIGGFLDVLEKDEGLHDADKLVFRDFLDELAARLQEARPPASPPVLARIAEDQEALRTIQALYQKEL